MSIPTTSRAARAIDYWLVASILTVAHGALFIRDLSATDAFLRADRARFRMQAMQQLISASQSYQSFANEAVKHGIIGDYGIHALLYGLCGQLGLIAFQVVLAILSAVCVVFIGRALSGSRAIALSAGLIYGLLPQSVAFPHLLLSEAISNPLLIFGAAATIRGLREASTRMWWISSGLAFGIAGLVRPGLLLIPLIAASLIILTDPRRRLLPATAVGLGGLAPFLLWCCFMLVNTGQFGPGPSAQDLGLNFSTSVAKVLLSEGQAPADGSPPESLPERLTAAEYLGYLRVHPAAFANLYAKSILVMIADSGIGRLYVDLLGFGSGQRLRLQDPALGWRAQLTNHGPWAMVKNGWQLAPGTILAGLVGALVFVPINIGVVVAYLVMLRPRSPLWSKATPVFQRWTMAFLLLIPIYVLASSLVVAYATSRHRSQGEFAWAILACIGWAAIFAWRRMNALTYPESSVSVAS